MRSSLQQVHPQCGAQLTVPGQWVALCEQDTWPTTAQGQWKVPRTAGGPAAVRNALTHRAGHTHSPRTVGGPALWAEVNFPRVSNLHLPISV